MRVEFDHTSLIVDGERRLIRSGVLHYFRLPALELWRDRIEKMRAAGLNAVTVVYPWSYHSEEPGRYNFAGDRDIEALHDLIEAAGLYLIARPGPHVGADLDLGGLPAWLLRDPELVPRCRDAEGYAHSPAYVDAAREWLEQVIPRVAARRNTLLVEVERGYALPGPFSRLPRDWVDLAVRWLGTPRLQRWLATSPGRRLTRGASRGTAERVPGSPYMRELVAQVRRLGVSVPLFHSDADALAEPQADVDLRALGALLVDDMLGDWRADPGRLDRPAADRRALQASGAEGPLLYADLQSHVSDAWRGLGYEARRAQLGAEGVDALTKAALAQRASAWSYSLFCGGCTFGYMGSPAVYTSYDGGAPVTESGRLTASYENISALNGFLAPYEEELAGAAVGQEAGTWCPEHLTTLVGGKRRFVFLRNATQAPVRVPTPEGERSQLSAWETQIRVYDDADDLEAVSPALAVASAPQPRVPPPLPRLGRWSFASTSPQLDAAYDDEAWDEIPPEALERARIDMDALGLHYGFAWYRGVFSGPLDRLLLDARHCYAIWINGRLIDRGDALRNVHGLGPDGARPRLVSLAGVEFSEGRNALVILAESLGHHTLLGGERNPRGLVHIDTGGTRIRWRFRGGLVRGERGMTPVVAFEGVERTAPREVLLPYGWDGEPQGVALFETSFALHGIDPREHALGLAFDPGMGKANLYLNGHLMGRYWPERGPQRCFWLPWGVLKADAENHLAVALWKRSERAALGRLRLELL